MEQVGSGLQLQGVNKEGFMALRHVQEVALRQEALQAIEKIAFLKWNEAGCPQGDAICYWLNAEREWKRDHEVSLGPKDCEQ